MANELSVAEAADILGLSGRRVRMLLHDGVLPGRHVGRAWVVSGEGVAALAGRHVGAGRPLAPARAWALLDMLDGGSGPWLGPVARSQIRAHLRRLQGADARSWWAALRGREVRQPVSGHRSVVAQLSDAKGVWLAGPAAAGEAGADLVVIQAIPEFYVPAEEWPALQQRLRLEDASGQPMAYIRIPQGGLWPFGTDGPARAALAASLLDGDDPRSSRAGSEILNQLAAEALA